ncbi:MAG: hypothetical protein KatS3mg018_1118 [Fimbriimonadales bacterium]|nr:MAG: hypothetical protein KatS3mg018_1118 [Fimbriimonadales bacterium]
MPLYWVNSFMFYASHQAFEALARGSEQAVGGSWAANPLITVLIKLYRYSFTLFGWDLADESLTRWIERYHRATGRIAIVLAMIMEATVALAVWSLVMSHLQVN